MTDLMLPAQAPLDADPVCTNVVAPELEQSVLAACTWKSLAPLMAAEPTMRLWNPGTRFDEAADLTQALPDKPAAVPLYRRGRTRLLALDFDTKTFGVQAVLDDSAAAIALLRECGAQLVVDESRSGGVHVLVPLEIAVTRDELVPLLDALSVRYRTLDAKPMLNKSWTGCITVPGSRCREGGFRVLRGSLGAAAQVFLTRNAPAVVQQLAADLGATECRMGADAAAARNELPAGLFVGVGDGLRLAPAFLTLAPLPEVVQVFASTGALATDGRWPSPSEARQSVLVHAMWRGLALREVADQMRVGGGWASGLGSAYARYEHGGLKALRADWTKATRWHAERVRSFHAVTHRKEHTGVGLTSAPHQHWLHHSLHWCDLTLRSNASRWTVAAVLQALAVSAARAGELVNGVPTVAVGGRSLSIAAGLVSPETVWAVLRFLRELPGAPVLLVAQGTGLEADRYALTRPDVAEPTEDCLGRAAALVEVHPAWWIVGLGHRRVYETVTCDGGVERVADIAVAARISVSAAYESVAELCRAGLLQRRRGVVQAGPVTLDRIAALYRLDEVRAERLQEFEQERQVWRSWLGGHSKTPVVELDPPADPGTVLLIAVELSADEYEQYLASLLVHGPPEICGSELRPSSQRLLYDLACA